MPFCLSVSLFLCFTISLFLYFFVYLCFSFSLFLCLSLFLYLIEIAASSTELPKNQTQWVDIGLFQGSLQVTQVQGPFQQLGGQVADRSDVRQRSGLGTDLDPVPEKARASDSEWEAEVGDAAAQVAPDQNVSAVQISEKIGIG
jgi:hypothetical protein